MGYGSCTACKCTAYQSNDPPNDYCWNCHHSFYMHRLAKEGGGGGCFITSATLQAKGENNDNCFELNTFREFRDKWLLHQEDGELLIKKYYEVAPKIVEAINVNDDFIEIYHKIWEEGINPCITLIQEGKNMEAKEFYKDYLDALSRKYLI